MIRNSKKIIAAFVFVVVTSFVTSFIVPLQAVEVKKKEIESFDDFQLGVFKGTGLDGKGRLFIGPRIKQAPGPAREYYLALATAANGDIYVGTGHQAGVYRVNIPANAAAPLNPEAKPGTLKEVFRSEQLDVYALAINTNGDIYAGTSPDGKLYKVTTAAGKNTKKEFFNPDEKFIWDVKIDKTGHIICAVGNTGGVYRITPAGRPAKIFTSEDAHIVSLYITSANSILAGSGDRGILYRIDNRKAKVLFDSPLEEIRGICEDEAGNIYFTATTGISSQNVLKNTSADTIVKKRKKQEKVKVKEKSILYCMTPNGTVEKIWTSQTEYIYTAFYHAPSKSVIIGTGNAGRVYRVKKDGAYSIIYESDSAQVFKIVKNKLGFTLIANNTASITTIENDLNNKGTYISDVYDLEIQSRLGKIYWDAQTPGQTNVNLYIRTGNSIVPDKTWTQWSPPFRNPDDSPINVPPCRYFQVKAILNSTNAADTPYLENFRVYYLQSNLAPQVKKISVKPPEEKKIKTIVVKKGEKVSPYLRATWKAEDQNKDKLKYNIFIKKRRARNWIPIKEDITINTFKLYTELYQDGVYELQVKADDTLSNPPSVAKSNTLVSSPFIIDSTAPAVTGFNVTGENVKFRVEDKTSIIARVTYSFDGKLWFPVFPKDMINDSKTEAFDFQLKGLRSKKFLFIKVKDEFDNRSVFQQEF